MITPAPLLEKQVRINIIYRYDHD